MAAPGTRIRPVGAALLHAAGRAAGMALILVVRGYQAAIRPMLSGACKYQPTCSEYAIEAIHTHGPARGLALAARRLARCRPGGRWGYDPVPPPEK